MDGPVSQCACNAAAPGNKPTMNRHTPRLFFCLLALAATHAWGWGNHTIPSYRALEQMPELAKAAPVPVESLESFLKAQEKTLEALLAIQEAWAVSNIDHYPKRPESLNFVADPARTDAARRQAFLMALRVAPDAKFALFYQPDPAKVLPSGTALLTWSDVNTLPEPKHHHYRYVALKPGDAISPLEVVSTASDEPDYGLDLNCWSDSPSAWGKVYQFGKQPFGNPAVANSTQAPFHMGFFHESRILYTAAPFIQRTFPLLRSYQYWSLAHLAFRTGHPYWGWRFAGLSLHYLQDLTQPYHARLAPGNSTLKLLGVNFLAMAGLTGMKNDTIVLLSNRHLIVDRYQEEMNTVGAKDPKVDSLEKALADSSQDARYPLWTDRYVRDVVAHQAAQSSEHLSDLLAQTLPAQYVNDPHFDFGAQDDGVSLIGLLSKTDAKARETLDQAIADLLQRFGSHTRNEIRNILNPAAQR